ncbi:MULTISPECIES: YhcH/YjgK/YiaL family protein [Yersinia]|jgi:biofilm protein TabA|uniref:YhcH/YjgK/YiaL family protein n=1 Tax=Yersinia TaxID=629 RepID=UPI0005ABC8E0|nr:MULTISPECIES: YhcH/YjgK/YiaL family protein [Yersinia]AJJ19100.1 yhcH/YjgK/YiaL family protein [Yersinia intermedia]ARB84431.1 YhcH/YjgK/YiaL family protein [Yersinia sp. FDAARGOS_228]AVL34206.1 YhcH/YjgK/YiaL family protein [Yersinia intermedia]MCB5300410.1 YhcH/YjgK/YiaL family protein [Yersinia intermedia]MCW8112657.1 YhcH/YjgK/YiaL family protein [Yersinia intermedia]
MILDELKSAANNPIYPDVIRRALTAICKMDLVNLPAGEQEIEGREIYLNHIIATTKPLYEQAPELHRYYIDIHILLEGSEVIGASPSAQGQRPTMDFDSERDYGLFEGITTETLLTLAPGDIALLFPGELHRPMGTLGDVAPIRKIVVKVANHLI